jgi:hypothetical protein
VFFSPLKTEGAFFTRDHHTHAGIEFARIDVIDNVLQCGPASGKENGKGDAIWIHGPFLSYFPTDFFRLRLDEKILTDPRAALQPLSLDDGKKHRIFSVMPE